MRSFETHDVFKMMRLVDTLGMRDELKKIALEIQNGKRAFDQQEIGADMIFKFISSASSEKAEKQIYDFLGGLLEIDADVIAHMDPMDLMENIEKLGEIIDRDRWKRFFTRVASMMR